MARRTSGPPAHGRSSRCRGALAAALALSLLLGGRTLAQDPLRPQPVVVNPKAEPPVERPVQLTPAVGTPREQGGAVGAPPSLGSGDLERTMAGASTESRAAAEAGHRELEAAAPEALWKRWLMVGLVLCGAGGLLLFAFARWMRQRTL